MTQAATEAAVLETVLPELEAEGFEVFPHPTGRILPAFLHAYQPDAIALRDDKKLLIAIVREGPTSKEKLKGIRSVLAEHNDWELRVFTVSSQAPTKVLGPVPVVSIEKSIAEIEGLIAAGTLSAAFVLSWATFEALGRSLFPKDFGRPQTPGRVVEVLASKGAITPSEADNLRPLIDIRNRLVHGEIGTLISKAQVEFMISVLRTLLSLATTAANDHG